MNEVIKNILTRRSIRSFNEKQISKQDLEEIVKAGVYAPTGMNKQSFQFTVIQNKDIIRRIEKTVEKNMDRPGYNMYNSGCIILVSNDRENGNGYADCACALENIFLAAHSMGIGSVWINQLKTTSDCEDTRAILNELKIPASHIVWGIAALGYNDGPAPEPKERKSVVNYF